MARRLAESLNHAPIRCPHCGIFRTMTADSDIDPAVSLALAVHAHKGVYALLVGSGLSRSAGIPTGWDVVLDLTRRVSVLEGQDVGEDPEAWYRGRFGKSPNYSELVEALAPTPAERMSLLKSYFEPTEEERQQGIKTPTAGHRAIARLVAGGYIKVLVTTNFDRLLERALDEVGVSPTTVSSTDQIAGMMPLPHLECLIFKVHGDYLDTRIRNTPNELAAYDAETNGLLDRVLTEYGLVVCGWSSEWDTALAAALERNTRHRFTTYWMSRGPCSQRAKALVAHRRAVVVPIESADRAFAELNDRVEALADQRAASPTSSRLAVAMMKRFLSETRFRIQLEDLVVRELASVKDQVGPDVLPLDQPKPDETTYPARVERIEVICSKLVPMVAAGAYWGDSNLDGLWRRCVETLARTETRAGNSYPAWTYLQHYPATLVAYAIGIAAILRKRFDLLKLILVDARASCNYEDEQQLIAVVGAGSYFYGDIAQLLRKQDKYRTRKTPVSDWMVDRLRPMLADVIGKDLVFEDVFDKFEFLLSLVAADSGYPYSPYRFGGRSNFRGENKLVERLTTELTAQGTSRALLTAGLFDRQPERLAKALDDVRESTSKMSRGW